MFLSTLGQSPTSCFQRMADKSDEVSREEIVNAAIVSMTSVTCQHVVDGGRLKLGCAYPYRRRPLPPPPSNGAERFDSLCRAAKVISRRMILDM